MRRFASCWSDPPPAPRLREAPMPATELHPAWWWTCDDCGRDNFVRATLLTPEQVRSRADDELSEIDLDEEGDWFTTPNRVTCGHCKATFDAAHSGGSDADQ